MPKQRRPSCSAAMSVEPEPRNGSSTTSPVREERGVRVAEEKLTAMGLGKVKL